MKYDCVIVLGGNIARTADGTYIPSTYQHSDEYGMLGGNMRVIAAVWMYLNGQAQTFVFSTGTSEKTKAALGPNVPTEAAVYSKAFVQLLDELRPTQVQMAGLPDPRIILEDRSQNTVGNIRECFKEIR